MASDAPKSANIATAGSEEPVAPATVENRDYSIGDLAREFGISLRALRHYQNKGLLRARQIGRERLFDAAARERLGLILQGKRLGFTLMEIRQMLGQVVRKVGDFPVSRQKCVEQISLLEQQRRDLDLAIAELRRIYTAMLHPAEPVPGAGLRVKTS